MKRSNKERRKWPVFLSIGLMVTVLCGPDVFTVNAAPVNAVIDATLDSFEERDLVSDILRESEQSNDTVIEYIRVTNGNIADVLELIAREGQVLIQYDPSLEGVVSVYLTDVFIEDALKIVLSGRELMFEKEITADGGVQYSIVPISDSRKEKDSDYTQGQNMLLQNAKVLDISNILQDAISEKGKIYINEEFNTVALIETPKKIEELTKLITKLDVTLQTEIFELGESEFEDVEPKIKELMTLGVGEYQYDVRSNSVIITDRQDVIDQINEFIVQLDNGKKQIMVTVKIIQVLLNDEHTQGVDWEAIVSDFKKMPLEKEHQSTSETGPLGLGSLNEEDFTVLLDALDTVGMVFEISEREIFVEEGQQADIDLDNEMLYKSPEIEKLKRPLDQIKPVTLSILPQILEEYVLQVLIKPSIKEKDADLQKTVDIAEENTFREQLKVADGSTMIMGNYFIDKVIESPWKIPLLGDIPFLGFVFRSEGQVQRKTEVIVFLTLQITDQDEEQNE